MPLLFSFEKDSTAIYWIKQKTNKADTTLIVVGQYNCSIATISVNLNLISGGFVRFSNRHSDDIQEI